MSPYDTGGALEPATAELIPEMSRLVADIDGGSLEQMRDAFWRMIGFLQQGSPEVPFDGTVEDLRIDGPAGAIPAQRWTPHGAGDAAVLFLHGGGWVLGGLRSAAPAAQRIAMRLGCTVVSIDYRLAPEHPYPAAFDDTLAALRVLRTAFTGWLGVAGDSAGGNLAAAAALAARDEGLRLDGQLLIYPAVTPGGVEPSRSAFASGYPLTAVAMNFYWRAYAAAVGAEQGTLAPLRAQSLRGVAPAVVVTAEFDLLRDEGLAYAQRLDDEEVPVRHLPGRGLTHGFIDQVRRVPRAAQVFDQALLAFLALQAASAQLC